MMRPFSYALGLVVAGLLGGCPSLPMTQSARTLGEGQAQFAGGLEFYGANYETVDESEPDRVTRRTDFVTVPIPYFGARVALADGLEFGGRSNVLFTNVQADLKIRIFETEGVAMAVDPALQYGWIWGWAHLPVLIGLDLGSALELVLSPRVSYQVPLLDDDEGELSDALGGSRVLLGGGLAAYIKATDEFAIVPEIQALAGPFGADEDVVLLSFNIGITIGDQPLLGGEQPPPPPQIPVQQVPVQQVPVQQVPVREHGPPQQSAPPPTQAPVAPPGYGDDPGKPEDPPPHGQPMPQG